MQIVEILLLLTIVLAVIGGLVALGIGHRRWNVGTVAASFLVLLSAATYLFLAARLASRDRAWTRKIAEYEQRLGQAKDGDGGSMSLAQLRTQHDRWRRGRDRVETWRGRVWQGASFQPPEDDISKGTVKLAAEVNAEDNPPIGVGSHVFLFDATPYEDGGAYIGAFLVSGTSYEQEAKRHVLEVVQTAPRDPYDAKVLARAHDPVTVYEDLPVDRWLAFYRSRVVDAEAADGAALPETVKEDAEKVRGLLETAPEVGDLVRRFVEAFARHEEDVPKADWDAVVAEAAAIPGTLWAEVEFTKPYSFRAGGEAEPVEEETLEGPKQDFEAGDRMEFDLQTALELRDKHEAVTIERVLRRRPLADALTLLHGTYSRFGAGPDGVQSDGASTLRRFLQVDLADLERSNERLRAAQETAMATTEDQRRVAQELEQDLGSWRRDARAATELAAGFEQELDRTTRALEAAEKAIVDSGRALTAAMARLTREIDLVAPPPERRAARP